MLFSEHFEITRGRDDDWFDPILDSDTKLFVDPFLIFRDRQAPWRKAHERLIQQFDAIFMLLVKGNRDARSPSRQLGIANLRFPEPKEFCIGYTEQGVDGAGGGHRLAAQIARAMEAAIQRGIKHLAHFELLGILNERIGPDRISDLTCTALKKEFVAYTVKVAKRHDLPTKPVALKHGGLDGTNSIEAELPVNPFSGRAILLVPQRFLRQLPTLNAETWWDYHVIKAKLNLELLEGVDKKLIVKEARANSLAVRRWAKANEATPAHPYDLNKDRDLLWQWEPLSAAYVDEHPMPLSQARTQAEFAEVIDKVCEAFHHYVEEDGGWELLHNEDGTEKKEPAVQNLFRGIAKHYCHANDISIDREVKLGRRGSVDFKFSRGVRFSAHLEVKKLDSGQFWDGLYVQLVQYMKSDGVADGWLMGVRLKSGGVSKKRAPLLPAAVRQTGREHGLNLRYSLVDARPKPSASKVRSKSKPN